jgi:hypothetical protein
MGRGRILRVKLGYNPNSSSLGTTVQVLLFGSAVLSVVLVFISTILRVTRRAKGEPNDDAANH